mmetsp:Transcript_7569/g.17350  ORF Transcript_7569/g.17350 Transcript_7569/m.17350 type:complete len:124 (+) Transcript_7569:1194-1565(+)
MYANAVEVSPFLREMCLCVYFCAWNWTQEWMCIPWLIIFLQTYSDMLHAQLKLHKVYNLECLETLKKLNVLHEKLHDEDRALHMMEEAYNIQKRTLQKDNVVLVETARLLEYLRKTIERIQQQ